MAVNGHGEIVSLDESGILSITGDSGHPRWTLLLGDGSGPPSLDEAGRCYVTTRDGHTFSVDDSGRLRWTASLEAAPKGGMVVGTGWVAVVSERGIVHWLSQGDGHRIAEVVTGARPSAAPVVLADHALALPTTEGEIVKLDARGIIWRRSLASRSPIGALALGADGEVYVSNTGGSIARVALDGTLLWQIDAHVSAERSPVVGDDGTLYVAAGEELLALDIKTGQTRWAVSAGGRIVGGPLIADDGILYVTVVLSEHRSIHAVRARLGAAVAISNGGAITSTIPLPSPPVSGLTLADHALSVGLNDGTIRRLHVPSGGLATRSPWPKARGGLRNCGAAVQNLEAGRQGTP
jgi:outer membrane protein assembly factor BamB